MKLLCPALRKHSHNAAEYCVYVYHRSPKLPPTWTFKRHAQRCSWEMKAMTRCPDEAMQLARDCSKSCHFQCVEVKKRAFNDQCAYKTERTLYVRGRRAVRMRRVGVVAIWAFLLPLAALIPLCIALFSG